MANHLPDLPPRPFKPGAERAPPSFDQSAVRRIQRILSKRANPKTTKKPVSAVSSVSLNPARLDPIHLRSKPLAQLSPEDQLYAKNYGAANIIKRRQRDLKNFKQVHRHQPDTALPLRPVRSVFIDDSAIESDGEGGDVESTPTTPASSRPSSPTSSTVLPARPTIKKSKLKKPREHCKTCNRYFDGPKQLAFHYKSKPHLKKLRNTGDSLCKFCGKVFLSKHNLATHKCHKFMRSETFYKLPF